MSNLNATEKQLKILKWIGTILLLAGVTLNTLNTPQWQAIVYPYNLYASLGGSFMLLVVARIQNDLPYMILNMLVMVMYIAGVYNSMCPIATNCLWCAG